MSATDPTPTTDPQPPQKSVVDDTALTKWDKRYIELAAHVASWSKDHGAKVGCVIVSPFYQRALTFSFNGFPANVEDNLERLLNPAEKYPRVLHAEQNALLYAGREAKDCHAYVVGKAVCNTCAIMLIQAGITRVVAVEPLAEGEYAPPREGSGKIDWEALGRLAVQMFTEANVIFAPIPRLESEGLIGKYGLDPKRTHNDPNLPCSCCEHREGQSGSGEPAKAEPSHRVPPPGVDRTAIPPFMQDPID
ncbi:MAG TPA: hypothetical protein VD995_24115 [Azospirillum sp.]|nr:hypothetical protein [Azospirillum sp.]